MSLTTKLPDNIKPPFGGTLNKGTDDGGAWQAGVDEISITTMCEVINASEVLARHMEE